MGRSLRVLMLGAVLVLVSACSEGGTATTQAPGADVVVRVVSGGEVLADWTLADLEASVGFTELTVDGDLQSGPLLLDVLEASGVGDWESGRVFGMGEGRVFEVALDIDSGEVDHGWILDVTNKGTLKLASANLPKDRWVRDVGEISCP